MFRLNFDHNTSLEELSSNLKSRLVLNARPLDPRNIDELLDHSLTNCEDAGVNTVKILDQAFDRRPVLAELYSKLSCFKAKYILIDYITEFKDKELGIKAEDLNFLIRLFIRCLDKPFEQNSTIDSVELVKLSDMMCLLSSAENKCEYDSNLINKDLIKLLIETLNHCHTIRKQANSKKEENPFKIISKLNQLTNPNELSKETFFGFVCLFVCWVILRIQTKKFKIGFESLTAFL